jgi:hypothetical protein
MFFVKDFIYLKYILYKIIFKYKNDT